MMYAKSPLGDTAFFSSEHFFHPPFQPARGNVEDGPAITGWGIYGGKNVRVTLLARLSDLDEGTILDGGIV